MEDASTAAQLREEQHPVEQELRRSEERFHSLVASIPGAVYRCANDEHFTLQYISEGIAAITGYSPAEMMQTRNFSGIIYPEDREMVRRTIDDALTRQEPYSCEYRIVDRDERIRWVLDQGQAVRTQDERYTRLDGVIVEITRLKQVEQELRTSEERFKSLYMTMCEGVALHELIRDTSGRPINYRIIDLNPAAELIVGKPRAELVGRLATEAYHTTVAPHLELYAKVAETGHALAFQAVFDPPGRCFRISAFSPGPERFATVFEDITPRLRAEAERNQLQEQLHQVQKMEAIGQLAAGMAHDFNNLLTAVLGNAELARSQVAQDSPIQSYLITLEEAARQGAAITRSLLTFSRTYQGQKQIVELGDTVAETGRLLSRLLPGSIRCTVRVEASPLYIEGDPSQLQQVVMNLALNARDAMPEGGDLLICVREGPAPTAEAPGPSRTRETVQLEVRDTGTGIAPEIVSRIFEPFYTTKSRGQGTGLGLAIVHGIVKQHGGEVTLQSSLGHGTTFTVTLPRVAGKSTMKRPPDPEEPVEGPSLGHGLILVAEDNDAVRRFVGRCIESLQLGMVEAEDGSTLMSLYRRVRNQIRLMILDVDLPNRNGLNCLQSIRDGGDRTPAIVITGSMGPHVDAIGLTHTLLLRKPFRTAELRAAITQMLADTG